jgi:CDP-paratose 2-epimerase
MKKMKIALVTGSGGLVGQACVHKLISQGFKVLGIDNDFRKVFFGSEASNSNTIKYLCDKYKDYIHFDLDIRNFKSLVEIFSNNKIDLIIHSAAQPSHDWAAKNPFLDFEVNANGTLNLLECFRNYAKEATFIQVSTNKVYGDYPNNINVIEEDTRYTPYDLNASLINENMPIDQSLHSLFGVSKASADLLVQEYGRYFNLNTACFRCGCITGKAHSGVKLHGFLSYLIKCVKENHSYEIIGYKGKQVRDNIHADDLVTAFLEFHNKPMVGQVFNMGGGIYSNCSVIEAINMAEELFNKKIKVIYNEQARLGDHRWYISDLSKFKTCYPSWGITKTIKDIFNEYSN